MYTIYKRISPSGKYYIGQTTKDIMSRWKYMAKYKIESLKKDNFHLYLAIKKYGISNWNHEILAICKTQEDANTLEVGYISLLNARNRLSGYNIAKGGNVPPNQKGKPSPVKGKKNPKVAFCMSQRKGKLNNFYGKRHSEQLKEKLRQIMKNNWNNPIFKEIRSKQLSGRFCGKRSDEFKKAQSLRAKIRCKDDTYLDKTLRKGKIWKTHKNF